MELLKVGDKVYNKTHERWGNNVYYNFSTVERLTKTQAVLSDGTKLVNNPVLCYHNNIVGYRTYGDTWNEWHIQTPDIIAEAKLEKERQSIVNWFSRREFSEEEIRIIYLKFQELNIL